MHPIIMAVIPARSGSKAIPHKNVRNLYGHPLIAWSIAAAKLSRMIDRVVVSTDSREYADIAASYGAEVPFLRPSHLSGDTSTDMEFVIHLLDWFRENEGKVPDYLVHLRPTCPARDPAVIDQATEAILADANASSLLSAHPVDYPPSKYYRLAADGTFAGYMGEEFINVPRQQCVRGYLGNGHADIMKVSSLLETRTLYGPRRLAFVAPDAGDLDVEEDFVNMERKFHIEGSPLLHYFTSNRSASNLPLANPIIAAMSSKHPDLAPLAENVLEASEALVKVVRGGGKILAAGNGGSCSDALHFSGELLKSFLLSRNVDAATREALSVHAFGSELAESLEPGIPVVVMGQNSALASAYLNDRKESRAFLAQECLALVRPGDILVVFSTSGGAENLLWSMAVAKAKGARTLAFTGKGGGAMASLADIEVRAPAMETAFVQEQHIVLYHAVCAVVERELYGSAV